MAVFNVFGIFLIFVFLENHMLDDIKIWDRILAILITKIPFKVFLLVEAYENFIYWLD